MPTLEARGVELVWEALGEGPPVVLVHESGVASRAWMPVAERIGESGRRAVVYDRRGWGGSSAPDGYARTTVEEQSEDLRVLLEGLGAPAALAGAGLGAVIALDLALRRPELVSAAVLVEPLLPGLVPEATEALSDDRRAVELAVHEGGVSGLVELYLSGGLGALGPGAERLPAGLAGAARERPRTLVAELGAAAGWMMPLRRLASAAQPAAVVTCADTPAMPRRAADALAARLRGAERVEAEGAGPPHLRRPEAIAALPATLG